MTEPGLIDHLVFVVLGFVFPLQAFLYTRPLLKSVSSWTTRQKLSFYRSNSLAMTGLTALLIVGWWLAGRPLAGLGIQLPQGGDRVAVLLVIFLFLVALAYEAFRDMGASSDRSRSRAQMLANTPFLPATKKELMAFSVLSLSAAVGEEVLFRGFLMTYILALLSPDPGAVWVALLLPACTFALAHYYQGVEAVLKIAVLSLTLGILFLLTRSLLYSVLLHLLVDLLGGWLGYRLLSKRD